MLSFANALPANKLLHGHPVVRVFRRQTPAAGARPGSAYHVPAAGCVHALKSHQHLKHTTVSARLSPRSSVCAPFACPAVLHRHVRATAAIAEGPHGSLWRGCPARHFALAPHIHCLAHAASNTLLGPAQFVCRGPVPTPRALWASLGFNDRSPVICACACIQMRRPCISLLGMRLICAVLCLQAQIGIALPSEPKGHAAVSRTPTFVPQHARRRCTTCNMK